MVCLFFSRFPDESAKRCKMYINSYHQRQPTPMHILRLRKQKKMVMQLVSCTITMLIKSSLVEMGIRKLFSSSLTHSLC